MELFEVSVSFYDLLGPGGIVDLCQGDRVNSCALLLARARDLDRDRRNSVLPMESLLFHIGLQ